MNLAGYKIRSDGTYAKTITFEWGITRKQSATETLVRDAKGKLIRVERSAAAIAKRRAWSECKNPPRPEP